MYEGPVLIQYMNLLIEADLEINIVSLQVQRNEQRYCTVCDMVIRKYVYVE